MLQTLCYPEGHAGDLVCHVTGKRCQNDGDRPRDHRASQPLHRLTRVMTPILSRSWAALREVSLGVERPLSGGDALARDRAVREVGIEPRLRSCVRLRASMLPLVTRVSISSARSSVDSFSSWIILQVSIPDLAISSEDRARGEVSSVLPSPPKVGNTYSYQVPRSLGQPLSQFNKSQFLEGGILINEP